MSAALLRWEGAFIALLCFLRVDRHAACCAAAHSIQPYTTACEGHWLRRPRARKRIKFPKGEADVVRLQGHSPPRSRLDLKLRLFRGGGRRLVENAHALQLERLELHFRGELELREEEDDGETHTGCEFRERRAWE